MITHPLELRHGAEIGVLRFGFECLSDKPEGAIRSSWSIPSRPLARTAGPSSKTGTGIGKMALGALQQRQGVRLSGHAKVQ